jgi:zinc protease
MRRNFPSHLAIARLASLLEVLGAACVLTHATAAFADNKAAASPATQPRPAASSTAKSAAPPPARPAPSNGTTPTPGKADPPRTPLALPVQKITLDNGLRVVMSVDHTSPTVAVAVTYDVGSRNEERGRSGFAHLFEHMMFEGSANVPKGEHFKLVSSHGGNLNGTTSSDRTNYFEMLPSSELALALWLEADRMKSLNVSAENFENQRKVVQEEYRMRVSNVAYAPAQIRLNELVFQGYWPYEHDPIGSMQDLDNAQLDWVRAFHDSYYAPNLAVLTIAGDFETDEATQLVHRFFDTGKKQEKVIAYAPPALPEQTAPRSASLEDSHAKTPGFFYGYTIPATMEPEHYALELGISILTDGESSRMHQRLVREKALAQEISGWTNDHRGPDLLGLQVKLAEGARMSDTEAAVDAMLDAFIKEGPSDAEMTKVKNRTEAAFLFGLQSNLQRAIRLGQYELFWGDARILNAEPEKYFAVSKDDIKRAMAKYITTARRTTVEVRPTGMVDPPPRKVTVAPAAEAPVAKTKNADKISTTKASKGGTLGKEREGGRHKPRHRKETP